MTHTQLAALIGTTTTNGVTIVSREKNHYGEYVYTIIHEGMTREMMKTPLSNLIEGKTTRTTISAKGKHVSDASDKGTNVTYKVTRKSTPDTIRHTAFMRINDLRREMERMNREIDLLVAFTSYESFNKENAIMDAQRAEAEAKKVQRAARVAILEKYVSSYDARIVDALKNDVQRAQMMLLQKDERIARANALIASLA
jgi:hypothetical protein